MRGLTKITLKFANISLNFPGFKGAQSNRFNFLSNFWRICYHKKTPIFLITHGKFYNWNVFRLEDISENLSGYGNHNQSGQSSRSGMDPNLACLFQIWNNQSHNALHLYF